MGVSRAPNLINSEERPFCARLNGRSVLCQSVSLFDGGGDDVRKQHAMNDWELIQSYCRNGSDSAFETLVKRHVDFVYCAALRQVRDPSLAEDVSQAVFLLLARKARHFRSSVVLVSWLFRTTHYIAARALRSEYHRQRRELEVANM